jgi:heat-inducible transcriptional repressor
MVGNTLNSDGSISEGALTNMVRNERESKEYGMTMRLSERQQKVLWATVNHYVATAEPVGSKVLAQEYQLSFSPATIRNVMGMLERSGLLYQPHTSAGRIPSDSGYRIYVNELMTPSSGFVRKVQSILHQKLRPHRGSFDVLLKHAAQLLAALSGCVALVTLPQSPTTRIQHVHLVQVSTERLMLIVVTDTLETQSVLVDIPANTNNDAPRWLEQELQLLSQFLNHHLCGQTLADLPTLDWMEMDRQFQKYAACLKQLQAALVQRSQALTSSPFVVGGLAEFLRQPEFSELAQAQTIIHLLEEEQDQLWPLISQWPDPESAQSGTVAESLVQIRIGAENPLKPIQNCALVSSNYRKGNHLVGSVGVLGPTRMAYEKVIALVEETAVYLSACLSQSI